MECSNRLDELVVKYENTLFRAALAILGDVQEAEDAVQDTFLRYLEKRPELRDGGHEKAWLLKVTANRCKSALRVWKRRPTVELLDIYPAPEEDGGRELVEAAKEYAYRKQYSFVQVKTVQMGRYSCYDDTNRFYLSQGFLEFEVFPALWDEWNPCQIYIMYLAPQNFS